MPPLDLYAEDYNSFYYSDRTPRFSRTVGTYLRRIGSIYNQTGIQLVHICSSATPALDDWLAILGRGLWRGCQDSFCL